MLTVRPGRVEDAERISALVLQASEEFIVAEFAAADRAYFLGHHSPAEVAARLAGAYRFYIAESGSLLVGVAAVREPHHLYYLFVAASHHRKGVARALWSGVLADAAFQDQTLFTVNSSNYAVAAYERLGFRRCGPQEQKHGVVFNPMEYQRDS